LPWAINKLSAISNKRLFKGWFGLAVILEFDSSWYVLFFGFLAGWFLLWFIRRKKASSKEKKEQLLVAVGGVGTLFAMELFATSMNLWNYTPGNWPVILWPTYCVAALFGYQLVRVMERIATSWHPY
jgi:uncharacterized membrane protein